MNQPGGEKPQNSKQEKKQRTAYTLRIALIRPSLSCCMLEDLEEEKKQN